MREIKNADSLFAYPLIEVLGKPDNTDKQCRNPRCVYTELHAYMYARVYNTPMSIYCDLFSILSRLL